MNSEEIKIQQKKVETSYITKEEFIALIQTINFIAVKECDIDFITDFLANFETGEMKPLTKNIRLNQEKINNE